MQEALISFIWNKRSYAQSIEELLLILPYEQPFPFLSKQSWLKGLIVFQKELAGVVDLAALWQEESKDIPKYFVVVQVGSDILALLASEVETLQRKSTKDWLACEEEDAPFEKYYMQENRKVVRLEHHLIENRMWEYDSPK